MKSSEPITLDQGLEQQQVTVPPYGDWHPEQFRIGAYTEGQYSLKFDGDIDEVRVYDGPVDLCVDVADCDDSSACTYDECASLVCHNTPRLYGDVNGDGTVNLFDIFCILDLIAGNPVDPECNKVNADTEPCAGNDTVNVLDAFAVLDAIAGHDQCSCP